jgi:hypothetical protein
MKKWTYLLSGIVIGAIVATSGSAFAAQVKSLIGQKVTGEYTVIVNGKTLQDKGAVIAGRTNAPVRAIADAIGAELKVEGKTINMITDSVSVAGPVPAIEEPSTGNKYIGGSKVSLEKNRDSLKNNILAPTIKGREEILAEIEILKTAGMEGTPAPGLVDKEKQLKEYDADIAKYTKELRLVEEALAALEAQQ